MRQIEAGVGRGWGRRSIFARFQWPGQSNVLAAGPSPTRLLLPGGGLLIVGLAYLWAAGLLRYYRIPKLHPGILGNWLEISLGFSVAVGVAFGCYYAAWRIAARLSPTRRGVALVCGVSAVLSAVLAFTYPILSDDMFYGIVSGRTFGRYGQNPFAIPPSGFPKDPFLPYAGWRELTMPYGPLWVLISGAVARLSDHGLLATVLAFKALNVGAFLLTTGLLARLLVRRTPRTAMAGLILWAWNPLVLVEVASSAHNGIVMMVLIVLACSFAVARRPALTLLSLALAVAVKYVALVLLPLFALHILRSRANWRAGLRALLPGSIAAAVVLVALYVPFWIGPRTLGPLTEAEHYYGSIIAAVRSYLPQDNAALRDVILRRAGLVIYAGCYVWLLRRTGRKLPDLFALGHAAVLLVLLLWPFFMPWYTVWLVPLAALTGRRRLGRQIIVLTGAALATYLCQFTLRVAFRRPVEFWSTVSAALVFGSLLVVTLAPIARQALRRLARRRPVAARPALGH